MSARSPPGEGKAEENWAVAEGKKKRGLSGPSNSDRAGQRHLFITFYFMGGQV